MKESLKMRMMETQAAVTDPRCQVQIGDRVRSYDFGEDSPNTYMEGTVVGVQQWDDCLRYQIRVDTVVFCGQAETPSVEYVYPPVNGTPSWGGMIMQNVVRLDAVPLVLIAE